MHEKFVYDWTILKAPKLVNETFQNLCLTLISPVIVFTLSSCVSGHLMNNQRKCQLGDYGEETRQ